MGAEIALEAASEGADIIITTAPTVRMRNRCSSRLKKEGKP